MRPRTRTRTRSLRVAAVAAAGLPLLVAPALNGPRAAAATSNAPTTVRPAASAAAAPGVPSRYAHQKLSFTACKPDGVATTCAFMRVPRDWNNPDAGVDLRIAVSRSAPAGVPRPARAVFANPGGPGGPGLSMAPNLPKLPGLGSHLGVGMDVRGTGKSSSVTCRGAGTLTTDPRDRSRSNLNLIAATSKQTATTCAKVSHGLLPYITTEQTVKDMDLLRALLGYSTIDYLGYSGGTWLGAYYETYFPRHVGRFVLDSNTDFTRPWSRTFEAMPQSVQRRYEVQFTPWVATYDSRFHLGATAAAVNRFYERLRADLVRDPVTVTVEGEPVVLDENYLDGGLLSAMYSKTYFQQTAESLLATRQLVDAARSHGSAATGTATLHQQDAVAGLRDLVRYAPHPLSEQYQTYADSAGATFLGITCNDTPWPRGQQKLDALSGRLGAQYPILGWRENAQPCAYWHRPSLSMPVPNGRGLPTTLMVQSQYDPATNASLGLDAHRRFAGSRLIYVRGEGDHAIFGGVNACVDRLVGSWFSTGRAPASDTTCQGAPLPPPTTTPASETGRQAGATTARTPLERFARGN